MCTATIDRVVKEGAEDRRHDFRVSRELPYLPRLTGKGRCVDVRFTPEALFSVQFLVLAELIEALDDVELLIPICMINAINGAEDSFDIIDLFAISDKLLKLCFL